METLITLPPPMAAAFAECEPRLAATCRPVVLTGRPAGRGEAGAGALVTAWQAGGGGVDLEAWLRQDRRLILTSGEAQEALPAYGVLGLPLMPMPVLRWSRGQRLDQSLADLQLTEHRRLMGHAPESLVVLLASGHVLLRPGRPLPEIPAADVVVLGVSLSPEEAGRHDVIFVPRGQPDRAAGYVRRPSPDRIREMAADQMAVVDTQVWFLSARAVRCLLEAAGWPAARAAEPGWSPRPVDPYLLFGLGGVAASASDLRTSIVLLPEADFFDLGHPRRLIESVSRLHNRDSRRYGSGFAAPWGHPDQHLQNSRFELPLRRQANHTLWIENCTIPSTWRLACEHVLTNVPPNQWDLSLEPGVSLNFLPVAECDWVLQVQGIDDFLGGPASDPAVLWMGGSIGAWMAARGLDPGAAGVSASGDAREARLFPVLPPEKVEPRFIEWLTVRRPAPASEHARRWLEARRLSLRDLAGAVNVRRLYQERAAHRQECLAPLVRNARRSVFFQLELEATARLMAETGTSLPDLPPEAGPGGRAMQEVRERMVQAAIARCRGQAGWEARERAAFQRLRELIEEGARLSPALPRCAVQEDQIVWGRSPVRLDLAGGWTDTPPYCLENGGRVVNVAANLNGQPPIQVFARLSSKPELVVRSIDLGAEQRVRSYEELDTFAQPGSEFALAKAAFALAGFLPRFHAAGGYRSLQAQLEDFGGGIEISLLAAVPKGSGLGTSSILAATLLATLGDLCGLGWDRHLLFRRTLALEQMVTTGGGWQDQAGGIFRGIKMVETPPGLQQEPTLRWLPDHLFSPEYANQSVLLYYTGLTRMAKGILHEVVRGVFLNSPGHLATLEAIGANADLAFEGLQKADYNRLAEAIRASWGLNQRLDAGTNPREVDAILRSVQDYLLACKLLGAGGGGYLLMLAKDAEAAARIRSTLQDRPPNAKARMVHLALSDTGLQLTRS